MIDTNIGHIELEEIRTKVAQPNLEAPYRRIKRFGLVEVTIFPQEIQSPELILAITQHYEKDTRKLGHKRKLSSRSLFKNAQHDIQNSSI